MAGLEPYSTCPCGSGQKFKWCCQKVEAFAEKAQRLYEGGQVEAAIKVLDEGVRKEPGNPWLLTRKAVMQIRENDAESAKSTLRQVLQKTPKHFGALVLLTRCVLETEGALNGAGMFQEVMASVEEAQRPQLASLARVVAVMLAESHLYPAALRHLELVVQLGDPDQAAGPAYRSIEGNTAVAPWLKDRLELAPAPDHLDPDSRNHFESARKLASSGLLAPAASLFDRLAGQAPGGEADYNLGLCRLWLGDEEGAVAPIRRRARTLGSTTQAVDLEILAQLIEPAPLDDRVEHVQLIWPLRRREALLTSLQAKSDIVDDGPGPIDPTDPESPEAETFALLDRPLIEIGEGQSPNSDQIPKILGRVSVGLEIVALETYDDGRVDTLGDRFTALAGSAIAPAHPRTKVLGLAARSKLALASEWLYTAGTDPKEAERHDLEQRARIIKDVWPVTPMPYLGFRTPEQAARDSQYALPLRAAVCQFEQDHQLEAAGLDFAALRARLNVEPEPAIDPATVDLIRLPLARLAAVPAASLDDDRLVLLYRRARRAMIGVVMETSARLVADRPAIFEKNQLDPVSVFSDLASIASSRGEKAEAQTWIARGRQADSPSRKATNAPLWDMIEVRLKARSEPPETWVPELAIVLDRYAQDTSSNQVILMSLVELGLVRLSPNPDNPEDVLLDSRPLQAVMAEYGPRVTTTSGRLGVSATKPELWTPGGQTSGGGGGALWTPGSGSGPGTTPPGDKPKLILPGR